MTVYIICSPSSSGFTYLNDKEENPTPKCFDPKKTVLLMQTEWR